MKQTSELEKIKRCRAIIKEWKINSVNAELEIDLKKTLTTKQKLLLFHCSVLLAETS